VCVVGCGELRIDPDGRSCHIGERFIAEGETVSLDGDSGRVYAGALEVALEPPTAYLAEVERWRASRALACRPA
jgi:pyruvate,orthophosphate dikinase